MLLELGAILASIGAAVWLEGDSDSANKANRLLSNQARKMSDAAKRAGNEEKAEEYREFYEKHKR